MTTRRAFLAGLGTLVAAPAVIRTPGLLMPVRRIAVPAPRLFRINWVSEEVRQSVMREFGIDPDKLILEQRGAA